MGRRDSSLEHIDRLIGRNIRLQRLIHETSRAKLAGAIGVSEQQVQKYESGRDRVSASRLFTISLALRTPIGLFFRDIIGKQEAVISEQDNDCSLGQSK